MREEIEKSSPNYFTAMDDGRIRLIVQAGRIEIYRRPVLNNPLHVPLQVRSAGRGRYLPGEIDGHGLRTHDYMKLIWCCSGTGIVRSGEERVLLKKNQVAVYLPGERHLSYADDNEWIICCMTIDGNSDYSFLRGFGLEAGGIFDAGPAPEATFSSLIKTMKDLSPTASRRASVIAYDILSRVRNVYTSPYKDSLVAETISIFDREWANMDIGVDLVAIRLGVHRSSLSRRFRQTVGISPSDYLKGLRMQHALTLIEYTREPIVAVARSCGFQDASYFSRLFRRVNGVTAQHHRKAFQSGKAGSRDQAEGA